MIQNSGLGKFNTSDRHSVMIIFYIYIILLTDENQTVPLSSCPPKKKAYPNILLTSHKQ